MKKIYVIGLGPGAGEQMTEQAKNALARCPVVVGYPVYLDLIRETFPHKIYKSTPMRKETERCRMAFEEADRGQEVAMVCSGDPGVYGMAGLLFQLQREYPQVQLQVIPGVTAATGGAALLGAPLMHDFAVISLSDLLTPWETIERRLRLASEADFVLCIYNPSSKKRKDYLNRACRIILESRPSDTVCGVVRQIGRTEESVEMMSLGELKDWEADMFTTVFVGNSMTREINGKMVTPRGYKNV